MPADRLTAAVRAVLDAPPDPGELRVEADGIPFVAWTWGDPARPPLLLVHGITSSSDTFWRIGPALAAASTGTSSRRTRSAHGRTGHWTGKISFRDNAGSIAAFIRAAGLDRPDLAVVGHSWGGMTVAELPAAGIRPAVLVLLDPPAVPLAAIASMLHDPVERHYDDLDEALRAMARRQSHLGRGRRAREGRGADGVRRAGRPRDPHRERRLGRRPGGPARIRRPPASPVRLVRGDLAAGGLVPDAAAEAIGAVIGEANVLTIAGGAHSPMRNRVEGTMVALLRALDAG